MGKIVLSASLVFGVGGALGLSTTAKAEVPTISKIAIVDMQRVLNETKAGKRARKDLETSSSAKQKKLDKRRKGLEADQTKLASLKGQKLAEASEKLQRDMYELQSMYMTLQQDLMSLEAKTLEKMFKNCQDLARALAKDDAVDLVLVKDQATVLYSQSSVDVTALIIKRYDAKFK